MATGSVAGAGTSAGGASAQSPRGVSSGSVAKENSRGASSTGRGGKGRSFGEVLGGGSIASHGAAAALEALGHGSKSAAMAKATAHLGAMANGTCDHGSHGRAAHSRADARDEKEREKQGDRFDTLDPSERHAAQLAPPMAIGASGVSNASPVPTEIGARTSMETLVPALVKKIAWSGDAKRGTVRIELGAGPLEGGTLLVHADDGRVRVHLSAPAGANAEAWKERIEKRLTARGLDVEDVLVD